MATRATSVLNNALIRTFIVKSGVTTVAGLRVKFDSTDDSIDNAGTADDTAFGTALEAKTGNAGGTVMCQVALDGHMIVEMKVGTGGATRGKKQKYLSGDGVTDAATNGGGTTTEIIVGIAMNSGVAADMIGVMPCNHGRVRA